MTTGIAVGISESIGGIPVLTAAFVIITGIFGAAFGPVLLKLLRIADERTISLAMGIGGHGIGTARAFQISDKTGAFSSLGMALNGIATAIIIPGAMTILHLSREAATPPIGPVGGGRLPAPHETASLLAPLASGLAGGQGRILLSAGSMSAVLIAVAFVFTYGRRRRRGLSPEAASLTE